MKISSPRHLRRREKLAELVERFGATNLASEIDTPKSHISALMKGVRGIGDQLARKLDAYAVENFGKPPGWIDADESPPASQPRNEVFITPEPQQLSRLQKSFLDLLDKLPLDEQGEVFADLTERASRRLGQELLSHQVDLSVFGLRNDDRRQSDQGHEPERRTARRHDDRQAGSRTTASKSSAGGVK